MAGLLVLQASVAFLAIIVLYRRYFRKDAGPSLPPGPKPLPILGNVRDLPPSGTPEYAHWIKFKDAYGPISSITVLGTTLVVLHDQQAILDLLEKQSTKTSGRPFFYFGNELCRFGQFLPAQPYDATFRQHRKLVHQQLGTRVLTRRFHDIQDVESRRFLFRVLNDPTNTIKHIKTEASAIILKIAYGYSIEVEKPDPLVKLVEEWMNSLSCALVPGSWLVDVLPFAKHLPEGFPGTSFKKIAREWVEVSRKVKEVPFEFVKRRMASGAYRPSYVASLLEQRSQHISEKGTPGDIDDEAVKRTAAVMYGGGADTSVSTLTSFLLAMTVSPEVQKRAQEEIDAVVGPDRLPGYGDRDNLPYVDALVKEALRWLPVVPMGTAHLADEEIIYAGFRIPKGSYLLPSVWWFLHDPDVYKDPSSFNPDRFLEPRNEPNPANQAFGYGRRICPGRFLADESIFLTVARVLATFTISKPVDQHGNEAETHIEVTAGLISRPVNFPYVIKPRSDKHIELIRSVVEDHPWEKSDAELLERDFVAMYGEA